MSNARHPQLSIATLIRLNERVSALFNVLDRERATSAIIDQSRSFPDCDAAEFWAHCEQALTTFRVELLHEKYDLYVWDAVWKTLKDPASSGQLPAHWRDKQWIAKDLHGACWVKITENIDTFKDGDRSSLSGWLWKVSQNVVYDWKRKEARRSGIAPMENISSNNQNHLTTDISGTFVSVADNVGRNPTNPWYRRVRTLGATGLKCRRWALCPSCGDLQPRRIISGTKTFTLECGHTRPRGL